MPTSVGEVDDGGLYAESVSSFESRHGTKKASRRSIVAWIKSGIFVILFAAVKESSVSKSLALTELVIDGFQVLAFPFSHRFDFPWNGAATNWFVYLCSIFVPDVHVAGSAGGFLAALAIVIVLLANAATVGYVVSRKRYKLMWTIRPLRVIGRFASTILFIPLLGLLAGKLSCDDTGADACGAGVDVAYKAVAAVFSLVFVLFGACAAAAFFDQNPKGADALARPHARVDMFYLFVRGVLTVLQSALPNNRTGAWVLAGAMTAGSVASAFLHTWYIPYYRFGFAQLRNATQWLFASASLCLILALIRNDPDRSEASILFYLTSPIVVALSVFTISARRRALSVRTIRRCRDVYEVELRIRCALDHEGFLFPSEESEDELLTNEAARLARTASLRSINTMYAEAVKRRPHSSLLHVFWANYYLLYLSNSNMTLAELANAEELKPPVDEQFMVYRQQTLLSEAASRANAHGGTSVIGYIEYQRHLADAGKFDRHVAVRRAAFWHELLRPKPDLSRLQNIGERISESLSRATASYGRLLKLAPESPQVLRMYASFLIEIMGENAQGEDMLSRAEAIEDARSKTATQTDECDVAFDDTNATVMISGARGREGTVVDLNAAACKLLGYRRSDLLSKNINMIIPGPIARNHNRILANYLASGYGSMLDRKRRIVCIHANSYVVPANIVIRQAIDTQGSTCFIGVIKAVVSDEHYVVLDRNGVVLSCTPGAAQLFGITIDAIRDDDVAMTSLVPDYPAIAEAAQAAGKGSSKPPVVHQPCGASGVPRELTVSSTRLESCGEFIDIVSILVANNGLASADDPSTPETAPDSPQYGPKQPPVVRDAPVEAVERASLSSGPPPLELADAHVRFDGTKDAIERADAVQVAVTLREVDADDSGNEASVADGDAKGAVAKRVKRGAGSVTSSNGGSAETMRQRARAIIIDKNARPSPESVRVLYGTLAAVVVVIVVAIASIVILRSTALDYTASFSCVAMAGSRRLATVSVARDVRTLVLAAGNMSVDVDLPELVAEVSAGATELRARMASLYTQGACLSSGLEFMYEAKTVPVVSSAGITRMSLWEAAELYIAKAMQISERDPTTLSASDVDVAFVLANGPGPILTAIESTATWYVSEVSSAASTLREQTIILSAVPLGCVFVAILCLVCPALVRLERRKADLVAIFLSVPRRTVRDAMDRDHMRLEAMHAQDGDRSMPLYETQVLLDGLARGESRADGASQDGDDGSRAGRARGAGMSVSLWRTFEAQKWVLLRVAVLLLVCVAYYTTLLVVGNSLVSKVSGSGEEVDWSDRRASVARLVFYHTRETVVAATNASAVEHASKASQYASALVQIDDGLLYGNATMTVSPTSRRESTSAVMFGNACDYVTDTPAGYPSCATFDNGLMTNGLHPAHVEYVEHAAVAVQAALALPRPQPFEEVRALVRTAPDLMLVRMLDWAYLQEPLAAATAEYVRHGSDQVESFRSCVLAVSIAAILASAALWVLVYRPMAARIEAGVRNTRLMLLMVPRDDSFAVASATRAFLRQW